MEKSRNCIGYSWAVFRTSKERFCKLGWGMFWQLMGGLTLLFAITGSLERV